jgi:hypothetical protein
MNKFRLFTTWRDGSAWDAAVYGDDERDVLKRFVEAYDMTGLKTIEVRNGDE